MTTYAFLKFNAHEGHSETVDTIPLNLTSVSFDITRKVLDYTVPLSSLTTGESLTVGADFGAAEKSITLNGFIVDSELSKSHGGGTKFFTAEEIAQIIAASVDSSGLAIYQNLNELVILIPSNVDYLYRDRDTTVGEGARGELIPFTFAARGGADEFDNIEVQQPNPFPRRPEGDNLNSRDGIKGYIQNFGFELNPESVEITFNMTFKQATMFPDQ